ncbi:uracil-DNA glycosylase family protein [Mycobacterium ulcerans]|uniref:Uracil DNA glycosylase superfamily protein n=1 Tax=Mycobacterium ulcerans str. Harvey TaxID=1299332 RepID=A0ABP3AQN0_MYCUL|nr:uracil-DNA glycosylase family protein [Mycobacterium ulcerans]EUA93408.1 uracil DNA glycosylase superfamily protein [Mycobacterium ulcerans str. Harvey]UDM34666.1 uracil-DNA glycosylase family protein [Mycobacterium ulcerans]
MTEDYDSSASRRLRKIALDAEIAGCRRCEGTNIAPTTMSAPGYGCVSSPVALIGQSLCEKCMESQVPFTGGSGELIDESIQRAGREKEDVFISDAVHCHPPKNRSSHQHEIVNCSPYLHRELEIVRPRLVVALGRDGERVLTFFYPSARICEELFEIPRGRLPKGVPYIFHVKHPSWIQRQHDDNLEANYGRTCPRRSGGASTAKARKRRARRDVASADVQFLDGYPVLSHAVPCRPAWCIPRVPES